MGFPFNGDLIPVSSGFANLGVEVSSNGRDAFDITELRPFGHVHMISGVFHDESGQSGVIRYNRQQAAFQVSVDGGLTFLNLSAGAVDSVGVIGGANLTGHVDFASHASGFIAITDSAGVSPLLWAVDHLGLSGLWQFPTQGFNGRVVNALTDFNGTEAQGVIQVVGASGILVDIIGQIMTITPAQGNGFATIYSQDFDTPAILWVVTHNLNTDVVQVQTFDAGETPKRVILPDRIRVLDLNTVAITFNVAQSGEAVVVGASF